MFARYLKITVLVAFLAGAIPPGLQAALASDDAGIPATASSSSGCPPGMPIAVGSDGAVTCGVVAARAPADQLHNPATDPLAALADERDLQRQGWAVGILGLLLMLARGVQAWAPTHEDDTGKVGAAARWLATGARAFAIAGLVATAGAAYNALALGGAWGAVVLAALGAGFAALAPTKRPAQGGTSSSNGGAAIAGAVASLGMLLVFAAAVTACSGSQRQDTIKAALVTVDAARDGFLTYDRAAQANIIAASTSADDAHARLADYRAQRDALTGPATLLDDAYHAIAFAAASADAKSLADMQTALAQLAAVIKPYLSTGASK